MKELEVKLGDMEPFLVDTVGSVGEVDFEGDNLDRKAQRSTVERRIQQRMRCKKSFPSSSQRIGNDSTIEPWKSRPLSMLIDCFIS